MLPLSMQLCLAKMFIVITIVYDFLMQTGIVAKMEEKVALRYFVSTV